MQRFSTFFLALLILAHTIYAEVRNQNYKGNAIYLELGGQGIGLSLNYDYRFHPHFTIRVGASFLGLGAGIPFSLTFLTGQNSSHHLELSLGATYAEVASIFDSSPEQVVLPFANIGYRYQPRKGGFIMRIGFTPFLLEKEVGRTYDRYGEHTITQTRLQPFMGISIGYCF